MHKMSIIALWIPAILYSNRFLN